jgi:hypothetical protein
MAAGYAVQAGSTANEIVLQLQVNQASAPVGVTAEIVAHPQWLESPVITISPGPPQAVVLDFDVADGTPLGSHGTVSIRVEWRSPDGVEPLALTRRLVLRVAEEAPSEQRSYRVEECCLESSGVQHDASGHPRTHVLLGNTPNPWRGLTSIRFGLPAGDPGPVTVRIHDVTGRRVSTIHTPALTAGYHQITWTGRDDAGALVPTGLYFYEISTARWRAAGRVMIVR